VSVLASVVFWFLAEMAEGSKNEELALARFWESMEKSNDAKITDEILATLSEDSEDREEFDFEGDADDAKQQP
jgi:hypothetical protein